MISGNIKGAFLTKKRLIFNIGFKLVGKALGISLNISANLF